MKNKNSKGFSAVEGLLLTIIVLMIAFIGYYVYHSQKTADDTLNTANQTVQNAPAAASVKYLDIKELGVKFKVSGVISDAYYVKNPNGYYYLSVHSFDNDPQLKGCAASNGNVDNGGTLGVVALIVTKIGEPDGSFGGGVWTADSIRQAGLKQVGSSYYGFQKGNGVCYDPSTTSTTDQNKVSDVIQAFIKAIPTFTKS